MSDDAEWEPWEKHGGGDCPLPDGTYAQAVTEEGEVAEGYVRHGIAPCYAVNCWVWAECEAARHPEWRVIKYRVRKPKGLQILHELIADLPIEPVVLPEPEEVAA